MKILASLRVGRVTRDRCKDTRRLLANSVATKALAKLSQKFVVRDSEQPALRIAGDARYRPNLECFEQRRMNSIFDINEAPRAEAASQRRDEFAVLVPEEMLVKRSERQGVTISRTSTLEPGITTPGHSRAIWIASSTESAQMIM